MEKINEDFSKDVIKKISSFLCGYEIYMIRVNDDHMDSYLEFILTDGKECKKLKFRYDYIYDFELEEC